MAGSKPARTWYVYLLRCADGTLYTGIALDPQRRLRQHNARRGARYTRTRLPVQLVGVLRVGGQRQALLLERRIKRFSPERKRALFVSEDPAIPPAYCLYTLQDEGSKTKKRAAR